jgi:hypothetical protein
VLQRTGRVPVECSSSPLLAAGVTMPDVAELMRAHPRAVEALLE